ncbi:MAG: cyclic lactone autoinducer peptide [Lachnospiraceae bacterium]|nr:cyclic lactone autoinducer peptide [Lachnospiraceae bacterium]
MKIFRGKSMQVLATFALIVATMVTNSACFYIAHQEPLPECAKRLRKF